MADVVTVVAICVFFALCVAFVAACDRIVRGGEGEQRGAAPEATP